jgi:glycosyltransferase involved in cell wall biosynthesis
MPVRNALPYLQPCLDSLLAQDCTDWELVAVDDHSTDRSAAVLAAYAKKDARITVIPNTGKGIIEALRLAYQYTKGLYITRMDADDWMPPNKLSQLSAQLLKAGRGHLATGLVHYFSEQALGDGYLRYAQWLNQLTQTGRNFEEIYKECVIPSPCWMLHRSDLDNCQAFHPNRYPEDYDLCFRFYEAGLKVLPSSEVLHHWRDSSGRTSRHDPHYANNSFLPLKIHYFIKLHLDQTRPLVVWGAGKKGKAVARLLLEADVDFHWVCNNSNKIGHNIYGQTLQALDYRSQLSHPQLLLLVAAPSAKANMRQELQAQGLQPLIDYFFFC